MTCRAARERQLERYRRSRSALVIFGKDTSAVRGCDQIDDNLLQMYFVGIYRRDEAGRDVQGDTSSLCLQPKQVHCVHHELVDVACRTDVYSGAADISSRMRCLEFGSESVHGSGVGPVLVPSAPIVRNLGSQFHISVPDPQTGGRRRCPPPSGMRIDLGAFCASAWSAQKARCFGRCRVVIFIVRRAAGAPL